MDQVVRHATELGIAGIVPLSCERSIVKLDAKKAASRVQRWSAIARSAAMQGGPDGGARGIPPAVRPRAAEMLAGGDGRAGVLGRGAVDGEDRPGVVLCACCVRLP